MLSNAIALPRPASSFVANMVGTWQMPEKV